MTSSVDPKRTPHFTSQKVGDYDWQALAKGLPGCQNIRGKLGENIQFLSRFISHESLYGDSEGARELIKALLLLESVDAPVSTSVISQTRKSLEYLTAYRGMLYEVGADAELCMRFDQLVQTFHSLLSLRDKARLGLMCSYGQLSQQLDIAS
ncbi:hypothetical protein HF888_09295 [Bermanella marisrubri]|uniref:Uncharacterized protein n=1 Tax=Bermanella marisrubri TaxID=207949 RepID=Q1N6G8_9GAMM|nr:hypothetical protein [Bermanella marisrubri]EAT13624.1 hypothetical protein RED65_09539 [Oceanobacter sp. RED65] [Bermanella marisrubri]QIZ84410.1 hypothetical protein HF888_09295 [Bermanella marisrubri]